MPALQGLSGLYPDPQDTTDYMDEGVLEAKANALDVEHGSYGSSHDGYSGTIPTESPYSPMSVYDGFDPTAAMQYPHSGTRDIYAKQQPGQEYDVTPTTHSSPYARTGLSTIQSWDNPDGAALVGDQMQALHGPELGGVKFHVGTAPPGHEEVTHYTTERYDAPNENYLSSDVPGQLRGTGFSNGVGASGHGNADPTQGYGVLNTLPEFQMGHSIRREQHDSVHFDYTNTHGEQDVPFPGRHPIQQMPLNGPDSPYFEMGDIDGANVPWEGRIGDPSPYLQPAEPTIGNSPSAQDYYPALSF
jgi:hypothetical protein